MRADTARPRRTAAAVVLGLRLRVAGVLVGCVAVAACGAVPSVGPATSPVPAISPRPDSSSPQGRASAAPDSPSATPSSATPSALASAPSATPSAAPTARPVRCADLVSSLSLRERVGQLMMVAVSSEGVGSAAADAIDDSRAGSVILLGNTTAGADRVARVVEQARGAARNPEGIETLVAADQEGGLVQRLQGKGFDRIPSAQRQAQISPAELKSDAARWGRQLRRVGIDANLAPVADVVPKGREGTNEPIGVLRRGYGSDPDAVARHVRAFTEGMD
ncbi:MAG TPA: glycoside hydrolase family 3 N-terminal domain-containing protein, partial [Microlunatus sp.]|nr:glycoside hydrolase family 3 N-terminal domain-containing protein [Microlunatus sp.]